MRITEDEYLEASESYEGYCKECDSITTGGVEPDAEGYVCDECGEHSVMGIEFALIMGYIGIKL